MLNTKRLRFECTSCGDCCRRPGEVRFDDETFEAIADYLQLELEVFRRAYEIFFDPEDVEHWVLGVEKSEPCPFLVESRCSIHAVRPRQCRTYPFWPEVLESTQSWRAERRDCPGIDKGPIINEVDLLSLLEAEKKQLPVSQLHRVTDISED